MKDLIMRNKLVETFARQLNLMRLLHERIYGSVYGAYDSRFIGAGFFWCYFTFALSPIANFT